MSERKLDHPAESSALTDPMGVAIISLYVLSSFFGFLIPSAFFKSASIFGLPAFGLLIISFSFGIFFALVNAAIIHA